MTKAFCPLSLSLIFKFCPDRDILRFGSTGVGFTVDKTVETEAEKSPLTEIFLNNRKIFFPTVLTALKYITEKPVRVYISSPLPLGCGFGVSGASALTAVFAVNKLLKLGKKDEELAEIAHKAEIENRTGLGTIGTQVTGGFLKKTKAGMPVEAIRIPLTGNKIYTIILGELDTPAMLSDKVFLEKVNRSAKNALRKIDKRSALPEILDISFEYIKNISIADTEISGLIKNIRRSGGHASMAIFGKVVISDIKPDNVPYPVTELTISEKKARLMP